MRYLSTFSGIGGFELGIELAYESNNEYAHIGTEPQSKERPQRGVGSTDINTIQLHVRDRTAPLCVGYSEIDKYASAIYQKHFPEHKAYGDITKIVAEELPDFDLLVGGFPCQAFSIAGKRGGFEDTRGTMFFELARILRAKQPRLCVFENVKGLLSHDGGKSFSTIIQTLDELGYDCQWQVLNSKNHGVPQNRERVFIVGHLRGTPRPQVFPFAGTDSKDIEQLNQPTHSNDRVYGTDGVSLTLNTMQGGRRQPFIVAERGRYEPDGTTKQRFEARKDNLTNTLTSVEKDNRVFDAQIRRLTPTECERLQGFPDGWTEGISDSQRYKCLGNAVTVNVILDIFERIL
jgi:DNA (cytosine-5)-methyltransferase 1